jgi:Arc/MetJ-type ribon-helix-helix transcriptional regulator
MDSSNKSQTTTVSASTLLSEIDVLVQTNCVTDALERARSLRDMLPRNIYVAGLQKQIEKLDAAEDGNSDEAQTARESVKALLDKAAESTRSTTPQGAVTASGKSVVKSDRFKAIENLKTQYFAHADNLMKKGDYENAAAEVRRVLSLDSSEAMAHAYLHKLEELVTLEKESTTKKKPALDARGSNQRDTSEKKSAPSASLNQLVGMTRPDFDSILEKTTTSNQSLVFPDPTPTLVRMHSEKTGTAKRRFSSFLLGSAFFIIMAIAASYFFLSGNHDEEAAVQSSADSVQTQTAMSIPVTVESREIPQPVDTVNMSAATTGDSLHTHKLNQSSDENILE